MKNLFGVIHSYRLEKARLKFITLMLVQLDLELIRIDDYVES